MQRTAAVERAPRRAHDGAVKLIAVMIFGLGCGQVLDAEVTRAAEPSAAPLTPDGVVLPYCDEMDCDLINGWSWTTDDGASHLLVYCQRFDDGNCMPNDWGCVTHDQGVECRYRE